MRLRRAVGLEGSIRRASRRGGYRRYIRPADAWRRRATSLGLAMLIAGLAARALMPWFIEQSAVRALSRGGWKASVAHTRLALWRATWRLEDVRLQAPDGSASLLAPVVEISLSAPTLKLTRPRSRLLVEKPRLELARAVALAEVALRLRALASDSAVEWRVEDGVVVWPMAAGPQTFSRVNGSGVVVESADGAHGQAAVSAHTLDDGRVGLDAATTQAGLLLRSSGSRLPGRFVLALETGEAAHLLAGASRGGLEPQLLSIPPRSGRLELMAAALSQALEAGARAQK